MSSVKMYQGNQIGGCTCVIETEYGGEIHRIMIDYGDSLPGADVKEDFEFPFDEEKIDAVFFTHNHTDHIGKITKIPDYIPLYMGSVANKVLSNMQYYLKRVPELKEEHTIEYELLNNKDRVHTFVRNGLVYEPITEIPGFKVEAFNVDHSAYDAYMFLVTAYSDDGSEHVYLHTGDFREHGRIGAGMIDLINNEIHKDGREVDTLIIEGTMMSRLTEKVMTEDEMMVKAADYLKEHKYAFLICSSTNLDSIASFYNAAQMASDGRGRYLYTYNEYFRSQLETFAKEAGPLNDKYNFKNVHVMNLDKQLKSAKWKYPMSQKRLMEITGFLAVIKPEPWCKKYVDAFIDDFNKGVISEMPVIIYSMWDGYLRDDPENTAKIDRWIEFMDDMEKKGVEIFHLHTSGHATAKSIETVINAVNPRCEIVPMHTEHPEMFARLGISEDLKAKIRNY